MTKAHSSLVSNMVKGSIVALILPNTQHSDHMDQIFVKLN